MLLRRLRKDKVVKTGNFSQSYTVEWLFMLFLLSFFDWLGQRSMQARVKWVEDVLFLGESGSGHGIVIDGPPEHGGRNHGVRPMELLLLGVGSCSAFDVVHILKKGRQPVVDCEVQVRADRTETVPKVFTRIHLHFTVTGKGLDETAVRRAVQLSAEKYCSASIMLGKAAEIEHSFEVVECGEQ